MKELAELYRNRSPDNLEDFKRQLEQEQLSPSQKAAADFLYKYKGYSLSPENFERVIQLEQAKVLVESIPVLIHYELIQLDPGITLLTLSLTDFLVVNSKPVESREALKIIRIANILKKNPSFLDASQLELIQKIQDGPDRRDAYLICYSLAQAGLLNPISFEQVLKVNAAELSSLEEIPSILGAHGALTEGYWNILLEKTTLEGFVNLLGRLEEYSALSKETIASCFRVWTPIMDVPSVYHFGSIMSFLGKRGLLSSAILNLLSQNYDKDWGDFLCHLINHHILSQDNIELGAIYRSFFVNKEIVRELGVLPIWAPQLHTRALNFIKEQAQKNSPLTSIVIDLRDFITTSTHETIKQEMVKRGLGTEYDARCRTLLLFLIQYDFLTKENLEQGVAYRKVFSETQIQLTLQELPFDNPEAQQKAFGFIMEQARNNTPFYKLLANFEAFVDKTRASLGQRVWIRERRLAHPTSELITFFERRCEVQIRRLATYKNPIAQEKHRILTQGLGILTQSGLSETEKRSNFINHIETHKAELLKPHSSLPKDIIKGLAVFVGLICGVLPGIYLAQRLFSSTRPTTTEEQIVTPALKI